MAADRVPPCYLDAWARLQVQRPVSIESTVRQLAIDDAGRFLDAWGADAAAMHWSTGELFDVPREGGAGGLVWQLMGDRVEALGEDHARFGGGRVVERQRHGR